MLCFTTKYSLNLRIKVSKSVSISWTSLASSPLLPVTVLKSRFQKVFSDSKPMMYNKLSLCVSPDTSVSLEADLNRLNSWHHFGHFFDLKENFCWGRLDMLVVPGHLWDHVNRTTTLDNVGFFISDSRTHDNPDKRWWHSKFSCHMIISHQQQFPCNLNT